jgi:hypothetical protein
MSAPEERRQGLEFVPVADRNPPDHGVLSLVLGVWLPALTVGVEVATRMCAEAFFDPLPTVWHVLAVSLVPLGNLLIWLELRGRRTLGLRHLAFANGTAMAIAGVYALLFLPLMPMAILGLIVMLGALPLAPVIAFVMSIRLRIELGAHAGATRIRTPFLAGLAAGIAALAALDVPAAATRLGLQWATSSEPAVRQRGIALLRTAGDEDMLLRLCYDAAGRPTGLLSAFVLLGGSLLAPEQRQLAISPAEAREVYYRVTGAPFNAKPAPHNQRAWARFDDFQFDADHGGVQVGGRIKGLDIASSRLDGSVSADDGVAYLEWTVEFRNASPVDRETRMQLALPPGGVVSRATLWVNGEEREAAYGGRAEVGAAYQRVAVQQRRDPLLVTTKGADRVLVQAFPVPRGGGTIKFKIGMTAPLDMSDPAKARLTLPAIVDRNFSFPSGVDHDIWIEGKQSLSSPITSLAATEIADRQFRLKGALTDKNLGDPRLTVWAARSPTAGPVHAWIGAWIGVGHVIRQDIITRSASDAPPALMLVVDGSARMKPIVRDIVAALDAIPSGRRVGAIVAAEPPLALEPRPWSDAQKAAVIRLLDAHGFAGGEDNVPALIDAMQLLERESTSSVLWVHGPQPVAFRDSAARLEQATSRLVRLPSVMLYSVEPGPLELLPDAPWAWAIRSLPRSPSIAADLSVYLARELGAAPATTVVRTEVQPDAGGARGSDHIVRLWARDRVLRLARENLEGNRKAAVDLAVQYRLVTPVSGAVVLETKQQYDETRLTPVSPATVPTIPEPHEWALMLIACAALLWLVWRRRQSIAELH